MEYLPDYTLGYEFDDILQPGARPLPNVTQGNTFSIGFNIPIFFWIHQREDVRSVQHSLQAARFGMSSVLSQTEASVTQLYQSAQFAYESAEQYKGALIPLADKEVWRRIGSVPNGQTRFPYTICGVAELLCDPHHVLAERQSVPCRRSGAGTGDGSSDSKMTRSIKSTLVAINQQCLTALMALIVVALVLGALSGCGSPDSSAAGADAPVA